MSTTAVAATPDALADVQSRVLAVQQRIATLSGASLSGLTGAPTTQATSTSRTFAGTLAQAQAVLAAGSDGTSGAASGTGDAVVADALTYLGTPYKWGGTDPSTGLDCSGFTQRVMADNGISIPRTAAQQATAGTAVPSLDQARPGDLVVLDNGHHVGIYVGNGQMINAPKTGDVVKIEKVWGTPSAIRRVTGDSTAALTGSTQAAYLRSALLGGASTGASSSAGTGGVAPYQSLFDAATAQYGLPAGLLSSVAQVESGGDAGAVSSAGAQGLMQLMPGTAADLGVDATDPAQAVDGAARLLSSGLQKFGSVPLALAAYNAGAGNVTKYGGIPPFAETQAYVRKVSTLMARSAS